LGTACALASQAVQAALQDAGGLETPGALRGQLSGRFSRTQANLGALMADNAGLTGIEAVVVEAAGASGGAALRQGSGGGFRCVDVALVVGVEKMTDDRRSEQEAALTLSTLDSDYEAVQGMTPAARLRYC
jgi:acetyl-CoA C-acetyltransferase